jgi:hypothetical protein
MILHVVPSYWSGYSSHETVNGAREPLGDDRNQIRITKRDLPFL